jgi:hypothetical protein
VVRRCLHRVFSSSLPVPLMTATLTHFGFHFFLPRPNYTFLAEMVEATQMTEVTLSI